METPMSDMQVFLWIGLIISFLCLLFIAGKAMWNYIP